jgi:hypothetical protein|tara:strand:+ start:153 stop:455 length:303 start_codon:yes stop_codon:yes gene_type:complete
MSWREVLKEDEPSQSDSQLRKDLKRILYSEERLLSKRVIDELLETDNPIEEAMGILEIHLKQKKVGESSLVPYKEVMREHKDEVKRLESGISKLKDLKRD